jgi:hypothetical protein
MIGGALESTRDNFHSFLVLIEGLVALLQDEFGRIGVGYTDG